MADPFSLDPTVVGVVLAMAAVTYATKASGLWAVGRIDLSGARRAGLDVLPGAVVVAFVAPALADGGPAEWLAAIATVAVARKTGNLLVSLAVGVGVVLAARTVIWGAAALEALADQFHFHYGWPSYLLPHPHRPANGRCHHQVATNPVRSTHDEEASVAEDGGPAGRSTTHDSGVPSVRNHRQQPARRLSGVWNGRHRLLSTLGVTAPSRATPAAAERWCCGAPRWSPRRSR